MCLRLMWCLVFEFARRHFLLVEEGQRSLSAIKRCLWSWQEISLAVAQWHIHQVVHLLTRRIDVVSGFLSQGQSPTRCSNLQPQFILPDGIFVCFLGAVQQKSQTIKGNDCHNLNCPHIIGETLSHPFRLIERIQHWEPWSCTWNQLADSENSTK